MYDFIPADFPLTPGVYLMKDTAGRIIYVGKALSLRRRLSSYFAASAAPRLTAKTRVLVSRVVRVDVLLTGTEKEALLLECSLIKKHRPRYNVLMKDDKSYSLLRLDREHPYPRITLTRRVKADKAAYFGPYISSTDARDVARALTRAFSLRSCSDKAMLNRSRPCLYHYLGQCPAPCVLPVDQKAYAQAAHGAEMVLAGKSAELMDSLKRDMAALAKAMEFEKAAKVRDTMNALRRTVERQVAALPDHKDRDLVALAELGAEQGAVLGDRKSGGQPEGQGDDQARGLSLGLGLGLVFVRQGRLMDQMSLALPGLSLEDGPEALESFLMQFYGPDRFIPGRITLPLALEGLEAIQEVLSERRGAPVRLGLARGEAERRLMDLAGQVAARAVVKPTAGSGAGSGDADEQVEQVAETLGRRLRLPGPVRRIEAVDASHLGGKQMRVGRVMYENGRPLPEEYRIYSFPGLEGAGDDYAALAAWAERRQAAGPPWPDLILVDGGLGQLSAVTKGFERGQEPLALPLAGIAKGETRRAGELADRIFLPGRKNPVDFKPGSAELLFLQQVRDAAHRFVNSRQRKARTKAALTSQVLTLPGVGPKTAKALWERFASVADMAKATVEELAALPGMGKARAERLALALRALSAEETGGA